MVALVAAATLFQIAAAGSPPVPTPAAPPAGPPPFVDGLCLRVAAGAPEGAAFSRLLSLAGARPINSATGDDLAPVDEPVQGQGFRLDAPDAPTAFIDARRGGCALVYTGAALPPQPLTELADDRPPTGADGAPQRWRKVMPVFVVRPRPPRWFLQVGAAEGAGVCADALTDLRRRDGQPVSMLRLQPCRLDAAEKVEPS